MISLKNFERLQELQQQIVWQSVLELEPRTLVPEASIHVYVTRIAKITLLYLSAIPLLVYELIYLLIFRRSQNSKGNIVAIRAECAPFRCGLHIF